MSKADSSVPTEHNDVNPEKGCPWMGFSGEAGSKEYAENTRNWLEGEFGGEWRINCTEAGWWYSEEVSK